MSLNSKLRKNMSIFIWENTNIQNVFRNFRQARIFYHQLRALSPNFQIRCFCRRLGGQFLLQRSEFVVNFSENCTLTLFSHFSILKLNRGFTYKTFRIVHYIRLSNSSSRHVKVEFYQLCGFSSALNAFYNTIFLRKHGSRVKYWLSSIKLHSWLSKES